MEINYEKYIKCIKTQCELDKNEWTFKNNKDFNEILEHLTKKEGIEYLKFIAIKFFKIFKEHKNFLINLCLKNDLYGNTKKFKLPLFTNCSPSNLRYILHSLLILDYINKLGLNNLNIIEIGGGYGGLCFFLKNISKLFNIKIVSYDIFDLKDISNLQSMYLDALEINNVNFYQINNYKNLSSDSFLISNYCFSEIDRRLQDEYVKKIINPYVKYGFLTWNFIPIYNFSRKFKIEYEKEFPNTGGINNYYVKICPL